MILELHERDTEVLEQILSILKNHPEIEKFEIDEEPMVSLPGLEILPSRRKVFRDRQEIQLTAKEYRILLLLATNKWLIAHAEGGVDGGYVGLKGENHRIEM